MDSTSMEKKPHAVCIPYPAQGHINAMTKLANLLHLKGFHITYVNTEFNHKRLLKSGGLSSLSRFDDYRFETIPDGLQNSDDDVDQDFAALAVSVIKNCVSPFRSLISKLNDASSGTPPVTCIVSDGCMIFTLQVAEEFQIPEALYWTINASALMDLLHFQHLTERGFTPIKDMEDLTDGYLDTSIDWIPGMKNIRLRDLLTFWKTTDPNDIIFHYLKDAGQRSSMAYAVILNTFDELERPVLDAMSSILPHVYTIGPISMLSRRMSESPLASMGGSSLWKEDLGCLEWLEGREPASVIYVNFGSTTVITNQQLIEFAWGIANSSHDFLWVIRPNLVEGESAVLPEEFLAKTEGRRLLASWCPQEQVLVHPSVGGFLTHCGWNSMTESISSGVPMICWPFFADQPMNCRYACGEWGIGMEINNNVKREEVEGIIRELMGGGDEKGKEVRKKALEWKERIVMATEPGGSSFENLERLVKEVLLSRRSI